MQRLQARCGFAAPIAASQPFKVNGFSGGSKQHPRGSLSAGMTISSIEADPDHLLDRPTAAGGFVCAGAWNSGSAGVKTAESAAVLFRRQQASLCDPLNSTALAGGVAAILLVSPEHLFGNSRRRPTSRAAAGACVCPQPRGDRAHVG
jgi:hypothetical protein